MIGQTRDYVKTLEEFVLSKWYRKCFSMIRGWRLQEEPEDTLQAFVLHCCERQHVERYNPDLYCFSSYIYGILHNFLCKRRVHENWEAVKRVERATSIDRSVTPNDGSSSTACLKDLLPANADDDYEFSQLLDELMGELSRPEHAAHSTYINPENNATYARDLRTVLYMLITGYTKREIATTLGTSSSFIQSLVLRLREVPSVSAWYARRARPSTLALEAANADN